MLEDIKWLFFDIGSTLVNEEDVYHKILEYIAIQGNIQFDKIYEEAIEFYKNNQKGDLELAKKYNIKLDKSPIEFEKLYSNVKETLKVLSQKYKIGIIANQPIGTANRLEKFGLREYISEIISSAEEGVKKPNPKIFEIALQRSGCNAQNAIMIGDRIDNDIVPAKAMGFKTIWIKQGFGKYWQVSNDEKECIDCEVSEISKLVKIL